MRNFCYDSQEKGDFNCFIHFQSSCSKYLDPVQVHLSTAPVVGKSLTMHITLNTLIIPLYREHYSIEGSVLEMKGIHLSLARSEQKYPIYYEIAFLK